jgi:hypothetical protein
MTERVQSPTATGLLIVGSANLQLRGSPGGDIVPLFQVSMSPIVATMSPFKTLKPEYV